jgi:NADH:ubiquinone oxidoreductase subunit F (NADH-binding)/ferredoxin
LTEAITLPEVNAVGPARLTAGLSRFARLDLRTHQAVHGNFRMLPVAQLLDLAELINLQGRGGAGFPFARKLRAVLDSAEQRHARPVVVVNATEGEPASWKDKVLLARAPHLILDGAVLAAAALRATEIVVGITDNGAGSRSLMDALAERQMPAPTRVVTVPHRFISGEGGALVRGANGELPIPPGRKTLSSDAGVAGLPTLLSNAETFAQLAIAARVGPDGYASVGTMSEPGTIMLTVGGSAKHPSVVEVSAGTPLSVVLHMCQADVGNGVLVGGFHGKWISAESAATALVSRDGLEAVGGTLGAGIILPLSAETCPLGEASRVVHYLAGESAGQCGPCRLGLPDVARAMATIADGSGGIQAIDAVRAAAGAVRGRGACSHPDGTARFALSALDAFADDVDVHVRHGGCGRSVLGVLPVPGFEDSQRRLVVDWTRCDGHGLCAHVVPELIRLDRNGFPAIPDTPVPAWLESTANKAVAMCPALALRINGQNAGRRRRRANHH